ncbi:DUF2062 domain-containing protein [bacterium]|nr:DUF2062 domain-containing protein [bacterium]
MTNNPENGTQHPINGNSEGNTSDILDISIPKPEDPRDRKLPWYDIVGQSKALWNKLIHLNADPHDIALGLAVGIFIGFLPIMGIQMTVALLVALPFRHVNKVAATAGVWITNPITVIPIYAFIYWVGTFLYPTSHVINATTLMSRMTDVLKLDGFVAQTKGFLALGVDIFLPMCIGGAVVGAVAAVPTYIYTKKAFEKYRARKSAKTAGAANDQQ